MTIIDCYNHHCSIKSDINEHLPMIKSIVEKNNYITEFGVRGGLSTWAILAGKPKRLISYDISDLNMDKFYSMAKKEGIDFSFKKANTCSTEIEPTDVLLIDTLHSYNQLKTELTLHHNKVKNSIIMHDTFTFGFKDMKDCYNVNSSYLNVKDGKCGLQEAIKEFLEENPQWKKTYETNNNNGLTVIERI